MTIYSETTTNTPVDHTPIYGENCYTCNNDCPGIILEVFRENSFEHDTHVNYLISSILVDEKHYYLANTTTHLGMKCLQMYYQEGMKFKRNIEKFGYTTVLIRDPFKRSIAFVFIHKNDELMKPEDLIYIFKQLDVIK